ncbi:hypothetical protein RXV94_11285 [Yeosuana sp. MJ-SS3]|jgi:hypothetical protein|uniref:Uncharacterized protein n=1 Tax=Gilvirhabdus luticola TaxID=3079858 RepID=A0ABU3U8N2_9FLAO|nr:hypothetical protein [Yeosuana sp. MJ-SS3]MDU8886745.1 hypothetical protein [Yeosuana sp. MJ-SS3]
MKKSRIAFFLSLIFLSLIITPAILSSLHEDFNFTMSFDLNEEENKGNELNKLFEFDDFQPQIIRHNFILKENKANFVFYAMAYNSSHIILHSPPPELL